MKIKKISVKIADRFNQKILLFWLTFSCVQKFKSIFFVRSGLTTAAKKIGAHMLMDWSSPWWWWSIDVCFAVKSVTQLKMEKKDTHSKSLYFDLFTVKTHPLTTSHNTQVLMSSECYSVCVCFCWICLRRWIERKKKAKNSSTKQTSISQISFGAIERDSPAFKLHTVLLNTNRWIKCIESNE